MRIKNNIKDTFLSILSDDQERKTYILFYVEILLSAISLVMTVINIFTNRGPLLLSTSLMFAASAINAVVVKKCKNHPIIGALIFTLKVFILFNYFILWGGTEGFSTIWLLMLPACGMFALGRRTGAVMSGALLLELMVLFYTPLKGIVLQYTYTESFLTRFPVLYLSFFAVGYFLEYVREITYDEMKRLRELAEDNAIHDQLTGLHNRLGFNREIENYINSSKEGEPFSVLIIDIDRFKSVNDTYGHDVGDAVLKIVADRISETVGENGVVSRWGGEEFAVLLKNGLSGDDGSSIAERINEISRKPIVANKIPLSVTVSIGEANSEEMSVLSSGDILLLADQRLYKAKQTGRDRCVRS